ncbi:unnamed protein product [Leptidea sinapis]|uniref:Cytosolic fatty-acid binding proteins domain-containing protein n=1 Tax=Leptidea sinapis TaxID=189913 RepID=A0A5E4QF29_9NEOP|nr:unnamed protein product [Leptidea sinapis]
MDFLGKIYKLDRSENFEEFLASLNLPEDKIAQIKIKTSQTLTKEGDNYVLTTILPDGKKEMKFQSGVEFDEKVSPEVTAKTTFTVSGNKVTQKQTFDDGKTINYVREFTADTLKVTLTSSFWDGTAVRYYVAE